MNEHYFTKAEHEQHLRSLADALEQFIPELERSARYPEYVADYRSALLETQRLLAQGFIQQDLNALSESVPSLFWLHRDWMPPLEESQSESGVKYSEPVWYQRLEPLHRKVGVAAAQLKYIGEY